MAQAKQANSSTLRQRRPAGRDGESTSGEESTGGRRRQPRSCMKGLILSVLGVMIAIVAGAFAFGYLVHTDRVHAPTEVKEFVSQVVGRVSASSSSLPFHVPHRFTKEELKKYDGSDSSLPLLLSILGKVYDVSAGRDFYGPEGGYGFFSGRDASRSFIDGCFHLDCFDESKGLDGLTDKQLAGVYDWMQFYEKEDKYPFVGYLNDFYDPAQVSRLEGLKKSNNK